MDNTEIYPCEIGTQNVDWIEVAKIVQQRVFVNTEVNYLVTL
jgi:hypothetical protein